MILLTDDIWEVKTTKEKGRGLFAKKPISQGTIIGDYIGTVLHPMKALIDDENFYLMYYHDKAAIMPDIEKPGVHLLNHACIPNCKLYIYKGHTLAFALKQIAPGEELTIHYLLAPKTEFCNPCKHMCRCGQANCTGSMHLSKEKYDIWRTIYEKQSKETKRERIRYGKTLPLLSFYPKKISKEYIKQVTNLFC